MFENGWRPPCRSNAAAAVAATLDVGVADLFGGHVPAADCGQRRRRRAGARPSAAEDNSSLRRLRLERGLSRYALARQAEVSKDWLSQLENGLRPARHSEPAARVAAALGVEVAELFEGYAPASDPMREEVRF